ncbi:glycosyltransferase family 2 protein [Aliiroseovarius sp. YM-037]|uniref:glycosyltransferase family 2 protein n=1 Tax=Aliiroseovarius sp. YM-037 TaxID=3341728 RepID=UPI003A801541
MTRPTVLTIILNYKTAPMTCRAAEAAVKAMNGIAGEIVIVDNDSGDGSFDEMTAFVADNGWTKDNRVRVLQSGRNGGFGAGNNVGIRAGLSNGQSPDYVYVQNSDAFPAPDAIHLLLDRLEATPAAGFAGSYIHGEEGDAHLTTFRFPSIASEFESAIRFGPVTRLLGKRAVPVPTPAESCEVDWLAGASLMMRQSVLNNIGVFDETFFLYFEETDLCRRAQMAGHKTLFVRESEVAHIGSVSTGMKSWRRVPGYWFDSRLHYFTKNHGALYAAGATLAYFAGGALHRLRCFITRRETGDPPGFLWTMVSHDLSALIRAPFSSRKTATPAPMTGE